MEFQPCGCNEKKNNKKYLKIKINSKHDLLFEKVLKMFNIVLTISPVFNNKR